MLPDIHSAPPTSLPVGQTKAAESLPMSLDARPADAAKQHALRAAIAEGEADLAAGRLTRYATPQALVEAIRNRSQREYGPFTPEP